MKAVSLPLFRRFPFLSMGAFIVCLSLPGAGWTQDKKPTPRVSNPNQKSYDPVLAAFRSVMTKPSLSTVKVLCDGKDAALGTIVGADGWVLTKASELKGLIACSLKDGRSFPARLVGVDESTDLAMLKIEATGLPAVAWRDSKVAPVGYWVATPGLTEDPVAIGVVSVPARKVPPRYNSAPPANGGYLGIVMDPGESGMRVSKVEEGSAADKAGFKANDIITRLGDDVVSDAETFATALKKRKADQETKVRVSRGESDVDLVLPAGADLLDGVTTQAVLPGAHIREVSPGNPAEKAGLKVKDVIVGIDDQPIRNIDALQAVLGSSKPGQEVKLKIRRGEKEMELKVTLGKRPSNPFGADRGDFQNRMGSQLSERRGNFPYILQHDTVLRPQDCGGPLVDLDGNVIGINIARAGRTESYAIPAETVQPLLADLMSGKLAPKTQPSSTANAEQRIVAAQAQITLLQAQQTEIEKRLKAARASLAEAEAALKAQKEAEAEAKRKKDEEEKKKKEDADKRKKDEEKEKDKDKK